MDVSKNRGILPPKWMVYLMQKPMNKFMIWGGKHPYFLETPICFTPFAFWWDSHEFRESSKLYLYNIYIQFCMFCMFLLSWNRSISSCNMQALGPLLQQLSSTKGFTQQSMTFAFALYSFRVYKLTVGMGGQHEVVLIGIPHRSTP